MVKMLTDAIMCRKHRRGVKEAGDTNTVIFIFQHTLPVKQLAQFCSANFQSVQLNYHAEIFVIIQLFTYLLIDQSTDIADASILDRQGTESTHSVKL